MNYFDMLDRGRKAALYAYLHTQAKAQNFGRGAAAGGAPTKQEPPTPPEPIEYDVVWDFIHNKASWDEAYNREGSPLKKYYEAHPEEDLWNTAANRAVNFNDRWYTGTIDGEEVSCGTKWAADGVQKINVDDVDYYFEIWSYGLDPKNVDLFYDATMDDPANKTFEIATVSFDPETCVHCWEGTINAPGAKLPWAVVNTKTPYDLSTLKCKIEFQYEGNNVYPWGDEFRNFPKGYGIASLPVELGVDPIDPKNQEATDTFDVSKLAVKGYVIPA